MRWKEILTESVKKYEPMFAPFRDENGQMPQWVAARIGSVEKLLQREDRVVWALRWERLAALGKYSVQGDKEMLKRKLLRDANTNEEELEHELQYYETLMRDHMAHWLSLPIHGLQNYVFARQSPDTVYDNFSELEQKWQAEATQKIHHETAYPETDEDQVDEDDGWDDCDRLETSWEREECREKIEKERLEAKKRHKGKIEKLIDFGDGWAWWDLNRGACSIEGKAMGHCGNAPSIQPGDTILSLRKDIGNGYFRPSLTFILHEGGWLGEMKGRANEKPNEKYHPYIVRLLKDHRIKGVEGGGYAANNNFSVLDLPKEEREELLSHNPDLMSIHDRLKLYEQEPSEENKRPIVREIKRQLSLHDFHFSHIDFSDPAKPLIVMDEWNEREDYIEEKGQWGPLSYMETFFKDLAGNLTEHCDDFGEAEMIARRAEADYFEEIFDSMVGYTHDQYALDGMCVQSLGSKVVEAVSVRDFLSPSSSYYDYDDEPGHLYDRIGSLDETCMDRHDWSDIKDSFYDLDEIGYEIVQYAFAHTNREQSMMHAVDLIYLKYSEGGGGQSSYQGARFAPHPDQKVFPFYSDPASYMKVRNPT